MEGEGLSVDIWFVSLGLSLRIDHIHVFLVMGYTSLPQRTIDLTIPNPRFGLRAAIDYREKSKKDQAGKTLVDSEKLLQYATDTGTVIPSGPPPLTPNTHTRTRTQQPANL